MFRLVETAALLCLGIGRRVLEDLDEGINYLVEQGKAERDRYRNVSGLGLATKADLDALARKIEELHPEAARKRAGEASTAIVIINEQGKITSVNPEAQRLFGYTSKELLGKNVEILLPKAAAQKHPEHRRAYGVSPQPRRMGEGLNPCGCRKDGTVFPVEIDISPLKTADGVQYIGAIRQKR